MTAADASAVNASAVARLSDQLGYPIAPDVIAEQLEFTLRNPQNAFYVAETEGKVIGWVHVYGVHLLESPAAFAEIGGLVVDTKARRQGIGRALVAEAEAWAREHSYAEVHLRSGLHRIEAHEFYKSIGYALTKTSHMFRRTLSSEGDGQ